MSSLLKKLGISLFVVVAIASLGAAEVGRDLTLYAGVWQSQLTVEQSRPLLEFSFSVNKHEFEFFQVDSQQAFVEARVFAQVHLLGSDGFPVDSAFTHFSLRAADPDAARQEGIRVFNRLTLTADPGVYSARVVVLDAASERRGDVFIDRFSVAPPASELAVTEALFAYRIRKVVEGESVNQRLVKNGLEVVPNPKSIYSITDSIAYVYAEAFNLTSGDAIAEFCLLQLQVLRGDSSAFRDYGQRRIKKPGASLVIAEQLDIRGWSHGNYLVKLVLTDQASTVVSLTPFSIVDPDILAASLARPERQEEPWDTLSLEHQMRVVHYLLNPEQKATLGRLTDQGKESYLAQFWKEQDPDPRTLENETRIEMVERYDFCVRRFSANIDGDDGWLTDRGRIYMTKGPYDQIDDRQAPLVEAPWVIWYYYSRDQGLFYIFQDEDGDNDYRIVHSNDDHEVFSREWERAIRDGEVEVMR